MKKYFCVLVVVVFIIPSIAFASFDRSLSIGTSGSDVEQLQSLLVSQNCLSTQPTGYFGSLTFAGLQCFQTKYNISATGYFGNLTRAQANAILATTSSTTQMIKSSTSRVAVNCPIWWDCTPQTSASTTPVCPTGYQCLPITQSTTTTSNVVAPTPTTVTAQPTISVPISSGPTVAEQTQACQLQYDNALLAFNSQSTSVQETENSIMSAITSDEQYINQAAANGTAGSGTEGQVQENLANSQAELATIKASNATQLQSIQNSLQSCLGLVH